MKRCLFMMFVGFFFFVSISVHAKPPSPSPAVCPNNVCTADPSELAGNEKETYTEETSLVPFSVLRSAKSASEAERKRTAGKNYDAPPPVVLRPERVQWVRISATDVNRIVCTGGRITDVFYSAEKGVKVEIAGHEAYLKLQVKVHPDGRVEYSSIPTEVYIICAGNTYGFIGRPKRIPSRVIYLINPAAGAEKNARIYAGDVDRAVVRILREVFLDRIPPGWDRRYPQPVKSPLPGLEISEIARYRIPGVGIVVRVLAIRARESVSLSEKDLLHPEITVNPVAISLEKTRLHGSETVRAVIIERLPEVRS